MATQWIFENRNGLIGCSDQRGHVFFADDGDAVREHLQSQGVSEVLYARAGTQRWLEDYITHTDAKASFSSRRGAKEGKVYAVVPVEMIGDGESIESRVS
jgi:hypothetical protein